jgi:hypothetical protein
LTFIFKAERLWNIINGTVPKSIAPTAAQIITGTPTLPAIGARSINWSEERDIVSYHILIVAWTIVSYTCSIMCNIKFSMDKASKIVPVSRCSRTKMYLKDKFYTLKMKESGNVTKHIHLFRAYLHEVTTTSAAMLFDEEIICIMKSMPPSYETFISSLMRQPNLTLQSLITNLIQEKTLMKEYMFMIYTMKVHQLFT